MSWYYQAPQVTGPHFIRSKNPHLSASHTSNGKGGFIVVESSNIPQGTVFGDATIHYGSEQHPQAIVVTTIGRHEVPAHTAGNPIRALISLKMPEYYTSNVKIIYFQYV
jgi:hypothetical protein